MSTSVRTAKLRVRDDGAIEVIGNVVGNVRGLPAIGTFVGPRVRVGIASTLGVMTDVVMPDDAPIGRVSERTVSRSRNPGLGHGDVLFRYVTETGAAEGVHATSSAGASGALVYRAPMAGRFYRKASPDKPSLVEVGEVVDRGRALGLVEVMKTFHRLAYGGDALPPRVRVTRALVEDGADIAEGDALFELEPVSG